MDQRYDVGATVTAGFAGRTIGLSRVSAVANIGLTIGFCRFMKLEALATAVVAAIAVAIGAVPIYAGGSLIYERIAYGSAASVAIAAVVSADRLWLRELISPFKRQRWEVTYEFKTAKGAVVRSTGIYTQSTAITNPKPGTILRVLYLPDDPTSSYIKDEQKLFDAVWYIGLGLFIWFVAGGVVWWEIRRARRKQHASRRNVLQR